MVVLKKARKMHATARTRPCSSTTDPKEDYKECGESHMECIDAVKQIWQSNDGGHLIDRVGPNNITDGSVKFMQSTLSDETIDAYLHVLTVERTYVYHINCLTMTSILTGRDYHVLLQHVDLQYQTLIGAVNEGGCHWTLMYIPQRKVCGKP